MKRKCNAHYHLGTVHIYKA